MGVVYLAHHTQLDRKDVLKTLPAEVASDPERLQRFEREAKLLAALNHPNINTIYGVVDSEGRRFLALEYLEGQSLSQRLSRGPLPVAEALEICLQIAAGLEAAHERGVIHRDLKPGNVMITPDNQVKIIDFGLAKGAQAPETSQTDSPVVTASSPTLTSPAYSPGTIPGVILGTAPYLSPEQARGKPVDRRTDIWSWGCVLYECLTGRMAFAGETVSDTLARILEREPDWARIPAAAPPRLRELLRRCLEKDVRRRLCDIGEARFALEELRQGRGVDGPTEPARAGRRLAILALGLLLGAFVGYALAKRWVPPSAEPINLALPIPPELHALDADITADGRVITMLARPRSPEGAPARIYTRPLNHTSFDAIPGTDGATDLVLSPDGRWIGYVAPVSEHATQQRILKVLVDGSAPPVPVCDYQGTWAGDPMWLESGDMLVATSDLTSYVRISTDTGQVTVPHSFGLPRSLLTFNSAVALPHDRGVLLRATSYSQDAWQVGIGLLNLKTGAASILVHNASSPHYVSTGHLLFTRGAILYGVPLDLKHLEVVGPPVAVQGGLRAGRYEHATFDIARNGVLICSMGDRPSGNRRALVLGRDGSVKDWSQERRDFEDVAASRDGRAAFVVVTEKPLYEIWVSTSGSPSRRLVAVPGADCWMPVWSPEGSRIAFLRTAMSRDDGIYVTSLTGSTRLLCRKLPNQSLQPKSWLSDGSKVLCVSRRAGKAELVTIDVGPEGGAPISPKTLLGGDAQYPSGDFSPDGRWLAYTSDEAGEFEAFVRAYRPDGRLGEPVQVSTGGAVAVRWDPRGGALSYITGGDKVMAVSVRADGGAIRPSQPALLWDFEKLHVAANDILPDGRAIAVQKGQDEEEQDISRFDITLNFFEELGAKMRGAKEGVVRH